jgi:uncharacterized protein (PEP-CTERM system associated)
MSRSVSVSSKPPGTSHDYVQATTHLSSASLLIGLVAQTMIGLVTPAAADDWVIIPSLTTRQSFTDNVRHAPRGREEADTFTSLTPAVSVSATGARLNLNFDYAVTGSHFFENSDLDGLQHSLLGGGTAELIPELLFFDARAAIFQAVVNPTGPQAATPEGNTSNTNAQTVKTYSLSPYLRNHLGAFADSELRYSFNQAISGGAAGSTTTNGISESLTSGSDFTRLQWTVALEASDTKASNNSSATPATTAQFGGPARDSSRRLAAFSPEYALNRYLILLGSIGYEKIDDQTLNDEPNGIMGNAGVRVNPGPRSTFRVLWNHRYNANYFTGDAAYLVGPASRLDFAYTRDIQTSQSLYSNNLSYLGTDQYGNFIDTRSNQGFQPENSAFGLSNAAFLQERYSLRYTTELYRNSFSAEAYREMRESQNVLATQTTNGLVLGWGRELTPLLGFNLGLTYTDSEFGSVVVNGQPREDRTVRGGPGLSYSFNETLTGSLDYNFIYRNSNAAQGDLRENVVTVGVRKIF